MTHRLAHSILALVCLWIAIVVLSGMGWNPLQVSWNFSNSGSFGDSFGPLGAIMAGIAAWAAFETLSEQRKEIKRIEERDRIEDKRRIQLEAQAERQRRLRQVSESRTLFEQTFFNMLTAHREIVREIDVGRQDSLKTSRDAFKYILYLLKQNYNASRNLNSAWADIIDDYKNDLNHYFRFLYHIVRFVDLQDSIDRYSYVRLVRAGLSEAELVMIAVNCAVGEGVGKFKPLVEKYALLHNISDSSKSDWSLAKYFDVQAFEYGE